MIEYYGWVRVLDNSYESDTTELLRVTEEVESYTRKLEDDNRILKMKWINGRCVLCVAGSTNHKTADVTDIIRLFEIISVISPGSYGILYLLDDEDSQGKEDEFQVYRIAKGQMTLQKDYLLSPNSTMIFD